MPKIPEAMKQLIQGQSFEVDTIGRSGARIFMFANDLVLKVADKSNESDGEREMLEWLQGKLPVPRVVKFHSDGKTNYLLMTRLNGKMACDPDIMADRENMVRLLAKGLKKLWRVDSRGCPRTLDLDYKLAEALARVNNNLVKVTDMESKTSSASDFASPMDLYEYLKDNRPVEEPVLTHGDYCLPNVFYENGAISGYLDLGYCGLADKWDDIAMAVRSLHYNLRYIGKEAEYPSLYNSFFAELGIRPDEEKIRYYILLDGLFLGSCVLGGADFDTSLSILTSLSQTAKI